jgi:hypothetical protein
MKKIIFAICMVFAGLSMTQAQDYNWTFQGDSNFAFMTTGDFSGGQINATVLYGQKLQVGPRIMIPFGDYDNSVVLEAVARYFVGEDFFAYSSMNITNTYFNGFSLGVGNRVKIGDRVEFNPAVIYDTKFDTLRAQAGFAIRL